MEEFISSITRRSMKNASFGDIKEHRDALARGIDNVEKIGLAAGCRHNKRR
jgi:hypothetical protein